MREVVATPMSPLSREIRTTASSTVAAAGLALRYPAFRNDISTAWRSLSDSTFEFSELVTSVTAMRSRSVAGAGVATSATILSDRAGAAQPVTATRRLTSGTDRRPLKKVIRVGPPFLRPWPVPVRCPPSGSFNHLVRPPKHRWRDRQAECLRGLEIDH